MQALYNILISLGLAFAFPAALLAQDTERPRLGPFEVGLSFEEALNAAPDYDWEYVTYKSSQERIGAVAYSAFNWIERDWNVHIGSQFEWIRRDEVSDIELKQSFEIRKYKECQNIFNAAVKAMETHTGPLGLHSEFGQKRSKLYGDPYGEGFKIKSVGTMSKARYYPRSNKSENYSTFFEASEGEFYRVMILGNADMDYKTCDIRVAMFIPYIWDKSAKTFVVPPELHTKYPGRYSDK